GSAAERSEVRGRRADLRARLDEGPEDAGARLDLVRLLEAAGLFEDARALLDEGVQRERSTVGPLHRAFAYRELVASGLGDDPEARVVAHLGSEADPRVLREGWALVSTLRADARQDRAALWRATRETYQRTRDDDLVPMLEALLERFTAAPDGLDALDRYFLKGRAAALAELAPDSPWPTRAREALEAARKGR
ncbi:MAG: tetratricopeptide repeat protein, partial [Planctomycetota bacterium]